MNRNYLAVLLIAAAAPGGVCAAEAVQAAAGLAFPSVEQGGGARAIAMGSTYVGIAEGSSSLLWNPAGLGTLLGPDLSLNHNAAIDGAFQEIATLGLPLGHGNSLGLSLNYEDNGVFDGRDSSGVATGSYGASASGGSLGWGIGDPDGLSLGLALKVNQANIAGTAINAVAGDVGVFWSYSPQFNLGASYSNLGPNVADQSQQLAQAFRVGLSSYIEKGDQYQWLFAVSGESMPYGANSIHFGVEHMLHQFLALRAGYAFDLGNSDNSGLLGWTFGGGIRLSELAIDYAFVPLGDLGSMQRISLSYAFGEWHGKNQRARTPSDPEDLMLLTDADFKAGEADLLLDEAKIRLDQAIVHIKSEKGETLLVRGTTLLAAGDAGEMQEIGQRRADQVRAYLVQNLGADRITSGVTTGPGGEGAASIFQVLAR